jgi:Transport and Golgi organisation 2
MCVLTYLPGSDEGFILTNNRDESMARLPAVLPRKYWIGGRAVFFPKDAQAGGTWLATAADATLVLLNGGFVNHVSTPPYRQSRGQIILDFLNQKQSIQTFVQQYPLEGIEPFTLLFFETQKQIHRLEKITELRWDGAFRYLNHRPIDQAQIWSSVTLYTPEVIRRREGWFADWCVQKGPNFDADAVWQFHRTGGNGDTHNDLTMNRNGQLRTQCITQVCRQSGQLTMLFDDLLSGQQYRYRIL